MRIHFTNGEVLLACERGASLFSDTNVSKFEPLEKESA
jgi:hypothetical protein